MKKVNNSGILPCGDRVLVKPDKIDEKEKKATTIQLPDWVKNKYEQAQATGVLIACGPDAFEHITERAYHVHGNGERELYEERHRGYRQEFAKPGDRIAFAKFTGLPVTGEDGERYILMNDQDITAKVSDNVEFTELDTRKSLGVG